MRLHIVSTCFVLFSSSMLFAQSKPIDLFDDQGKRPAGKITVSNATGQTDQDSADLDSFSGGFRLRYERAQSGILVPAKVNGKSVYFLFDTGASFTTLSGAFAKSAGAYPGKNAPVAMVQTANGPAMTQYGIINNLNLGGRPHSGVTFSVCDACPSGIYRGKPIVGLLGLNVLGRYRTSFDDAKGEIEMNPASNYSNRFRDAGPFIELGGWDVRKGKKGPTGSVIVNNRSKRRLEDLVISFRCENGKSYESNKATIGANKKGKVKFELKTTTCGRPDINVEHVAW